MLDTQSKEQVFFNYWAERYLEFYQKNGANMYIFMDHVVNNGYVYDEMYYIYLCKFVFNHLISNAIGEIYDPDIEFDNSYDDLITLFIDAANYLVYDINHPEDDATIIDEGISKSKFFGYLYNHMISRRPISPDEVSTNIVSALYTYVEIFSDVEYLEVEIRNTVNIGLHIIINLKLMQHLNVLDFIFYYFLLERFNILPAGLRVEFVC